MRQKRKNIPAITGKDFLNTLPLLSDCDRRKVLSTMETKRTSKFTSISVSHLSEVSEESSSLNAEHMRANINSDL